MRHPGIDEFGDLLERDALVRMQLERMISEVPEGPGHPRRHQRDLPDMLRMLDAVLLTAPEYSDDSMVMTPVQAVLDQTTATPSGLADDRNPTVNAMFGKELSAWCTHLDGSASLSVLHTEGGWTSKAVAATIGIEPYQHDPDDEHRGFTSWNDFFTRRFREGGRRGGSTHCLLFRPGALADTAHQALPRDEAGTTPLVRVRTRIATAAGKSPGASGVTRPP